MLVSILRSTSPEQGRPQVSYGAVSTPLAVLAGQEQQSGLDAPAHIVGVRQVELHEDGVDVLLDCALGQEERFGYRGVALALSNLAEDLVFAAGQLRNGRRGTLRLGRDEHVDHGRIDYRLAR